MIKLYHISIKSGWAIVHYVILADSEEEAIAKIPNHNNKGNISVIPLLNGDVHYISTDDLWPE